MKSYQLTGIEQFGLFDVPVPICQSHEALVEVKCVGVCGSDVHYYSDGKIGSQIVEFPWTVGHEGAGIITSVGKDVTGLAPGDRIAFDPLSPCGHCEQCLVGRQHTCVHGTFLGCPGQISGCLAEYVIRPAGSCYKISEQTSFEEAAMAEPLSIAVYGVSLCRDLQGATIAVLGCGPIGLSVILAAKAAGAAKIYATDKLDDRLFAARKLGADWIGNPDLADIAGSLRIELPYGLDAVFECCGQQAALDDGVKILKPGGQLLIIGIPSTNQVSFDISLLRRKEILIQNVRRQNNCVRKSLDMIAVNKLAIEGMITHRFNFYQTPEAFDLVKNYRDGVIKAMISFDSA